MGALRGAAGRVARLVVAALLAATLAGCGHLVVLHDPLKPAEHNDLGVAYQSQGQLALAEREFKAAIRLDPHDPRAWLNLGNVSAAQGRWARATTRFRRSLREDPRSADAMNNLAFALIQVSDPRFDEAEALARAAVEAGGARDSVYRTTLGEVRKARETRTPPARR